MQAARQGPTGERDLRLHSAGLSPWYAHSELLDLH